MRPSCRVPEWVMSTGLRKSYVHGGGHTPLKGTTVDRVLDRAAEKWPDKEALVVVDQGVRLTYRQLRDKARRLAAGLLSLGLEPGDRIGMLATNRAEWLITQFGTAYGGFILVNINPAYRAPELEYALHKVSCRGLITEAQFKSSDYIAMVQELRPRLPELSVVVRLGDEITDGTVNFDAVVGRADKQSLARVDAITASLDFDDPINIQFTSGTTGAPKAATLTHHNIVNNASMSASILRFTEQDKLCIPVPMYHCFGMVLGTLLCSTSGATMVFPSAGFEAKAVLAAIESEGCTALHGVPTMFFAMLDDPEFGRYEVSTLRTGIMAGAPCPVALMKEVMNDLHMPEITIGYGMTETGPLATQTLPDDPIELRVGTVGKALPNTEIKIVDEDGHIVSRGEPGELYTRGYCVMRGYWGDPENTAESIDTGGWMHTGDVATMDDDGYVRIVGRSKDMLIRGGENIFPREIEEFLYHHPKIDQVEVIGVPDEKFGEEIAACILLAEGETATADEIRDFCRGKLAHFKIPRYVKFVDEFPMTVTGKVQKFILREQFARELEAA